ncbi:MAG TPA: STAS domain-containing protein [Urbifossiella sp.]|nr:STAS domain-containing protein [Urbifossiella sp.]
MTTHPIRRAVLSVGDADALDRELDSLCPAPGLVLDLSAVEFLSSTALARFLRLHREVREGGGRLSLVNVRPAVYRVFVVARLDRVLDVSVAA